MHQKPNLSTLPGGWDLNFIGNLKGNSILTWKEKMEESIFVLHQALDLEEINILKETFVHSGIEHPVSIQGRLDIPDDRIGSVRATAWSENLAIQLWEKLQGYFDIKVVNDYTSTDWWQNGMYRKYKPFAISPMLRFMKYQTGGEHYAHYDAAYIYPDARYRTLMSMVIYLTTNEKSGATRFIEDGQSNVKVWDRDHEDWAREALNSEVIHAIYPQAGDILFFDHRICHDVMKFDGPGDRIIIRGDVIFYAED